MSNTELETIQGVKAPIPLEIFKPAGEGPWPAVLVIHELLGLNNDIRRIAGRFAENGYLAACPDLMADGGRIGCIRAAVESLRKGEGPQVAQLEAGIKLLRGRADTSEVGVAGFCMGGGFATLLATRVPLGAAAVFYGDIRPSEELKQACPIVAGYGGRDKGFRGKGKRLQQRLTEFGIPNDVKIYPEAGHCYMNKAVPGLLAPLVRPLMVVDYHEEAAEDSWRRMLTFFAEHLASGQSAAVGSPGIAV